MSKKYFTGLNYTLGNEDTTVEVELVRKIRPKKIFSICGSGGRALPLASFGAEEITLSDLSQEQIYLAQLREATYKQLEHRDFLLFWGYFPYGDDNLCASRKKLFYQLRLNNEVKFFFTKVFTEIDFTSVLYTGKWERTFQTLAKINRLLLGKRFDQILRFDDLEAQRKYYATDFPMKRWRAVIFLLGNKTLFNALLYKGDFIEKNAAESHFHFYLNAFDRLFKNDLAQKSFFLNLCFYGKIQSLLGVPVEASFDIHEALHRSKTTIDYCVEDFVSHLARGDKKYDFLSLSDVPSYFKADLEINFMQMIKSGLLPGAIVVIRYYLRKAQCNLDGYQDITESYQKLFEQEKVQVYDIRVYQYQPEKLKDTDATYH